MLRRKIEDTLAEWKAHRTQQAIMVMGARQVGKTTAVRQFAHSHYAHLAEVNFLGNEVAKQTLAQATDASDLLFRISALTGVRLDPENTLLFLDEVQECQDMLTWVKFLAERTELDVVLSGSLLGLDAYVHVRSLPVGFLRRVYLYPLSFEEFCWANGILPEVFDRVRECYERRIPVSDYLHERLRVLFFRYLIVGGMPDAVQAFVDTSDSVAVRQSQRSILEMYEDDIAKYVGDLVEARQIKMVFRSIPGQLNTPSKRFQYARLGKNLRFANMETAFDWLGAAGTAILVPHVGSCDFPLGLSEDRSRFKLFPNDVGLLTAQLTGNVDVDILMGNAAINKGSIFEAVVAQELVAHGVRPWYYSSKRRGEVDFVIEDASTGDVLPIEVKSGKDYRRHTALRNLLADEAGSIRQAVVLHDGNVELRDGITYLPVYMAGLLAPRE